MLNAVLIFSARGELLVAKFIKHNLKRSIADAFRIQVINNLDVRSPILTLGSTTFHHIRSTTGDKLWLVAVSRSNTNSGTIWEYLYKLDTLMDAYSLTVESVLREQFMTCYELFDISLAENGTPRDTELNSVLSKMSQKPQKKIQDKQDPLSDMNNAAIPKFLTRNNRSMSQDLAYPGGKDFPWRPHGIRYKKNEIFLFVNEKINILVSRDQSVLKAYVDGTIDLASHLSGTPICQFGLNDSLSVEPGSKLQQTSINLGNTKSKPKAAAGSVLLEDCNFHQCVSLDKFNQDRVIRFVPPDGSIELMKYHVRDNLNLPFKVTPIVSTSSSGKGLDYRITLKSLFPSKLSAREVSLRMPVPPGTIDCKISTSSGKCKFVPEENCMIWKFSTFNGLIENKLNAVTISAKDTTQATIQQWPRPSMSLHFEVLMFSNSGLVVRYFNILEKDLKYQTVKWIKYISKSGSYEIRY